MLHSLNDLPSDCWKEIISYIPKIQCISRLLQCSSTIYNNIISNPPSLTLLLQLPLADKLNFQKQQEVIFSKYGFYFTNVVFPQWFTEFEFLQSYCHKVTLTSRFKCNISNFIHLHELVILYPLDLLINDLLPLFNLKKLVVKSCTVHGDLSLLQRLEYLDVAQSNFSTNFSKTLPNVTYLDISYSTEVSDSILNFFPSLNCLVATNTPLRGVGLQNCPHLHTIDFRDSTALFLTYFKNTPFINKITMGNFPFNEDEFLELLQETVFQNLKTLSFACSTRVNSVVCAALATYSSLHCLDVKYSNVSNACFVYFSKITELNMNGVENISSESFAHLQTISNLSLDNVRTYSFAHFWNIRTTLTCLSVCMSECITSEMLQCLTNLKILHCSGCVNVTDSALENKPYLIELAIDDCPNITTKCFKLIPQVKKLYLTLTSLHYATSVTIEDFYVLNDIRELSVGDLFSLTNVTKQQLEERFGLDVLV